MMSFEEFDLELEKALEEKYPSAEIRRTAQYKINGMKHGFVIALQSNIQPIVYTDDLYEAYQRFEDMEFIIENLDRTIECEKVEEHKSILKDWNLVKEHIYPYIINADKNQLYMNSYEYLFRYKLDFIHGLYVEIEDSVGISCVNITKKLLELWSISEEEVFEVARKNAKYIVKPMKVVIAELMGVDCSEINIAEEEAMYVITKNNKNRGAAGMIDMDMLRKTAESLNTNFYILPSSVHEVILVLEDSAPSKKKLKELVEEVNQTQVKKEEFLSDNVYFYSRDEHQLTIVEMD